MARPRPPAPLWRYTGQERPPFAEPTRPGEESVWDYPRPPRIVSDRREVRIRVGEVELARTNRAIRVLETASPPTFYLPPDDVDTGLLAVGRGSSHCEWKGAARYYDFAPATDGAPIAQLAWAYPSPYDEFADYGGWFGFYPNRGALCTVDGERVRPQPGRFYAGWVTNEIKGPVKGEPGSEGW